MKLSKEEKELILKKRKEEEEPIPQKIGFLKEDLYISYSDTFKMDDWIFSGSEKEKLFVKFSKLFKLACPAGYKFECYLEYGDEMWYNDLGILEDGMNATWAKKYLKDIQSVSASSIKDK